MQEIEAFLILSMVPGLGAKAIRTLVKTCGSALSTLHANWYEILPSLRQQVQEACHQMLDQESWRASHQWLCDSGAQILPFTSPDYPEKFKELSDAPAMLYLHGNLNALKTKSIALIGTRRATSQGMDNAHQIAAALAQKGWSIVSGLAAGIDTAAHQGALQAEGQTVAVMGTGLANIYPASNQQLAKKIPHNGALLSEYSIFTTPDRHHFPQRNRLVAALSDLLLLIEAPRKSGAMHTMKLAAKQGKPLLALPKGEGNQDLIKTRKAIEVETLEEIEQWMNSHTRQEQLSLFGET